MIVDTLRAQRHDPPAGWPKETFDAVTDAIAAALVSAIQRDPERETAGEATR